MPQTAFVEELLKRFGNQCPTKTSAFPANPLIDLGSKTERMTPEEKGLIGRRLEAFCGLPT